MSKVIKVSARSRTASVAGAIAGVLRQDPMVLVQAIGADAVNQSVKAAALARRFLAEEGRSLVIAPSFTEVEIDRQHRTAVRLVITADLVLDSSPFARGGPLPGVGGVAAD